MLENIVEMAPEELRGMCLEWFGFMENDVDCWPFGGLVHQRRHWARVLVNALAIGAHEGLSAADLEALAMAAALHDTRRRDSWVDWGHGARGADHYRELCDRGILRFDPRAELAIRYHDVTDDKGLPEVEAWDASHGLEEGWRADALTIWRIFKDSDGLDRIRLNPEALDVDYLRMPFSKTQRPFAEELLARSQEAGTWGTDVPVPRRYLVVVDVQNDFVDGSLGTPEAQAALPAMAEKAAGFDGTVVFTKDTHTRRYLQGQEGRNLPVEHCIVGTQGWDLAPALEEVRRERDAAVYLKGAFGSIDLAHDLEAAHARGNLESVEFIGLCTDICVASNALLAKAQMPQVPISVDARCCAGVTPSLHEAALATMRSCQVSVIG